MSQKDASDGTLSQLVVTFAADLFGRSEMIPHDERYDRADEYMDLEL